MATSSGRIQVPSRTQRPRSRLWLVIVLVLIVIAGGAAAYTLTRPAANLSTSTNSGQQVPAGSTQVILVLDGWSYKTLGSTQLTYTPVGASTQPYANAAPKDINFTPATNSQINQLLNSAPALFTAVFARLATSDPSLACTATGCTAAGQTVPVSYLTSPSTTPGYGPEYAGYGITHGLYIASAVVPDKAAGLSITGPRLNTLQLSSYIPNPATTTTTDPTALPQTPDGQNGYNKGIYPISAGLGQLFTLNPSWVGPSPTAQANPLPPAVPAGPLSSTQTSANAGLFSGGLSHSVSAASSLDATQLSYMTSPTTGCGPAVACTPTASGATLTATTPTTQSTCYESTPIAITASLSDSTWQLTYRAPTSQYGAWNGTPPAGYNAATGLYTGAPTLVSGPQKLRQSAALLYTSAPAQLSALFGSTAQYGHSSPSALTTPFDASSLAAFGSFTACKSQSFTNP